MDKRLFIGLLWVVFCRQTVVSQIICNSQRYQDSVFHSADTISGVYFAVANPYGLVSSQNLYLDIYQPANDTLKKRPLIVFQHGGSFLSGTRDQNVIPSYATYFAKCGYVVASIDYRLGFNPLSTGSAERAVYRAIQDLRASVRFLCQNAAQYGVDTNSVFITGTSAGCISGLCSAFINEQQFPSAIHGTFTESSDLGAIDSSGNTDFGNRYVKPRAIISHWGAILDTTYITTADSIPVLCIQGTSDPVVPYITGNPYGYPIFPEVYGSLPIATRLTNLRVRNKLVPLPGYGHEPEQHDPSICDTMNNEGREFLWRILKPLNHAITGPDTVCRMHPATYSVSATAGSKYCWQLNGAGVITDNRGNTITVLWSDSNNVSVGLTEINYMDAQADPVGFQTYVIPPVAASFGFSIYQQRVTFYNISHLATGALWFFGNGDTSTALNPVENFAPGTYTVTLVAMNGNCTDSGFITRTVIIDSCPVAHFTYQVTGTNGFFYADTTNTTSYDWNFGDGQVANVNAAHVLHQYQHSGTYEVSLTVQNQTGCRKSDTAVIFMLAAGMDEESDRNIWIDCGLQSGCEIKLNDAEVWYLEVYDLVGRKLIAQQIRGNYKIETSGFQRGVYLLKLYNYNQSLVRKFIMP